MTVKIIQQNLDRQHKKDENYAKELIDKLLGKSPDVLLFSEFCYAYQKKTVVQRLETEGYKCFYPISENNKYKDQGNYDCVCMMALKENFSFEQTERKELDKNDLRYIEGTLRHKDKEFEINLFFVHVPCVPNKVNITYCLDRIEYKAKMLFGAFCFWMDNRDSYTFIGGDFNSEINDSTRMSFIFKRLYKETQDTVQDKDKEKPTWKDKRLDYALVSQKLFDCKCLTELLDTTSDHTALMTTFEI